MADQVLYRKYRPARFDEAVGQDHVVKTLTAALVNGRTSHAYLFTGPRGTGKTTVARLLARALNCTGPEPKPCNACPNCQAALSASLDLVEIDAASNRSIDSIRELKDKISLAPTQGKYKVYIIDEVHMLTTEAFNALLKTLEEPPAHAVFILATTEAHKLPATIISRTQAFRFKPIGLTDLIKHLGVIATAEQVTVEPAALEVIAQAARGGFRDAISLLDQLISTGAQSITAETARGLLGYTDDQAVAAISQALAVGDARAALIALSELEAAGTPAGQLINQLTDYWRAQLRTATTGDAQAALTTPGRAAQIVQALLETSRSTWPQLALEATVVQLAAPSEPIAAQTPPKQPAKSIQPATPSAATAAVPESTTKPVEPATEAQTSSEATPLNPNLWPKVLVLLKTRSNSLAALVQMYPTDFSADEITIKPRFNFHRDLFNKPANNRLIEAAAAKVYGRPVKIFAHTDETAEPAISGRKPSTTSDPNAELVASALEILGGEVVD